MLVGVVIAVDRSPGSTVIYALLLLFFFFQGYGDHRDLHSFPTRRSSDLTSRRISGPSSSMISWAAKRSSTSLDRKSTRLNSSHPSISYAVFCLKKKKNDGGSQRRSATCPGSDSATRSQTTGISRLLLGM